MKIKFLSKSNESLIFRKLNNSDGIRLGNFFELLSEETRSKFGFKKYGEFYTEHNGLDNIDMMLTLDNIE